MIAANGAAPGEGAAMVAADTFCPLAPWNLRGDNYGDAKPHATYEFRHRVGVLAVHVSRGGDHLSRRGEPFRATSRLGRPLALCQPWPDGCCEPATPPRHAVRQAREELGRGYHGAAPLQRAPLPVGLGLPPDATFATQTVYGKPSQFIRALLEELPPGQKLTREQTLLVAKFASACDQACKRQQKPPEDRRPPGPHAPLGSIGAAARRTRRAGDHLRGGGSDMA